MRLLVLWSPLADYTVACFKSLQKISGVELHIVYQPSNSEAPYSEFDLSFFATVTEDKNIEREVLISEKLSLKPDVIIMASWNYSHYMKIAKKSKTEGTYVISTFDGQWEGTLRQRIGIIMSSFYLKPSINNFFVPGDRQATFARKLGFKNPYLGYYCANTTRFSSQLIRKNLPPKFIFVGRLTTVKGVDILAKAYQRYRQSVSTPWTLEIYGKGELLPLLEGKEGIKCNGFKQPEELSSTFLSAGCFILPSYFEPWGVVVHEAALAGLPIIASHKCGAITSFVRDGQNGFIINPDEDSLLRAMIKISEMSSSQLEEMSLVSRKLGELWTVEKWAYYVYNNIIADHL